MTYKQAMLANFGSACCCYLGLIVGFLLGFKTDTVQYIYGIAGGMFLYISLVEMVSFNTKIAKSVYSEIALPGRLVYARHTLWEPLQVCFLTLR